MGKKPLIGMAGLFGLIVGFTGCSDFRGNGMTGDQAPWSQKKNVANNDAKNQAPWNNQPRAGSGVPTATGLTPAGSVDQNRNMLPQGGTVGGGMPDGSGMNRPTGMGMPGPSVAPPVEQIPPSPPVPPPGVSDSRYRQLPDNNYQGSNLSHSRTVDFPANRVSPPPVQDPPQIVHQAPQSLPEISGGSTGPVAPPPPAPPTIDPPPVNVPSGAGEPLPPPQK
jgi:hypothetical protein